MRPSWGSDLLALLFPVLFPFLVRLPTVSAATPLHAEQFTWEFWFHPDQQKINFVLGFSPSQKRKSAKTNKPSAAQHPWFTIASW